MSAFARPNFAPAASGANDPYFANVILLLGMNGANGATATVDDSSFAHAVGFLGGAKLSTAQAKFGASSLLLNSAADYLRVLDVARFDLQTGDYTIEWWWFFDVRATGNFLVGNWNAAQNALQYQLYDNGTFYWTSAGVFTNAGAAATPAAGVWHHFALTRSGSTYAFWLDGVKQTSFTNGAVPTPGAAFGYFTLFNNGANKFYFDEVRFTKGVCRYDPAASGFAVPTAAFPRS